MSDMASDISTLTIFENNENPKINSKNQKYSFNRKHAYSFSKEQKYSVGIWSKICHISERVQPYLLCVSLVSIGVLMPIVVLNYSQQNEVNEKNERPHCSSH